jgi:hypothetical protein
MSVIELPEDDSTGIQLLVDWIQTGGIDIPNYRADYLTSLPSQRVLGNKYLCHGYCNFVMKKIIRLCNTFELYPDIFQKVFETTTENSKLRLMVLDALQAKGPFRELTTTTLNPFREEWLEFICDAGDEGISDTVRDCILAGGFHNAKEDCAPWKNVEKYMEEWKPVDVEEFRPANEHSSERNLGNGQKLNVGNIF